MRGTMLATLAALLAGASHAVEAQAAPTADSTVTAALASWIALPAPPGRERLATDVVMRALPGWQLDALGDLVLRRGSGRPRRVVACALDEAGYAVSEITADGYLRLHEAGRQPRHPLWDQFHEGQRVLVLTRRGALPGVVGVRSTHLWRGRGASDAPATVENFWVELGAHSRAETGAMGVELLDPVVRDWPHWTYADLVAGPAAADRAGCAAVAAAATHAPSTGETIYVLSVQSAFGWSGLSSVLASLGDVDTLTLATARIRGDAGAADAVVQRTIAPPFPLPTGARIGATIALTVRARFAGTLVESVRADDAVRYARAVSAAAGLGESLAADDAPFPTLPAASILAPRAPRRDSLAATAALLATFTDTYAVSGHEAAMRDAVRAALPDWARARTREDSAGNLVLALGPARDTAVFVAHLDEVGLEVTRIAPDGVVSLRQRGGFYPSLWEGQTALLHLDERTRSMLRGVFVPRDTAHAKQPHELIAWFGLDSAALVARGVRVGSAVTSAKVAARLGTTRVTARAIDDRAGCTALVLAVRALDPAALRHAVVFVWSTREEVGLDGAEAAANTFRRSVQRVYAIDTFVSSDSPLESTRFALAPLGRGPVARALDNSSVTPPAEVDRVADIARRAGVPLQIGTTNGGNDGSAFVRYGATDIPIGWPLRFSHSPAEVADLADITALGRLVAALALH
jgi:putative aminopeptidase FrvX